MECRADLQETADALSALFRGTDGEDAEMGALILADAFDQLRAIRISLAGKG